jgi:hypothetical protein
VGDGSGLTNLPTGGLVLPYTSPDNTLSIGTLDAYGRQQIHYSGVDSVLRLGSDAADGDSTNVDSEGIVIYDVNPSSRMARIKADRIGLTDSSDASLYYFRVDANELFVKDNAVTNKILDIDRSLSKVAVTGSLQYADGNQASGKVLTSDANGIATWQTPTGGSFAIDASPTSNTCYGATSCVATCAVGKLTGGGCSTAPMVSPSQGFPFNSTDYECDTTISANITAYAICGH